jgi:Endonuclease/Exonuclease/phosphatase family
MRFAATTVRARWLAPLLIATCVCLALPGSAAARVTQPVTVVSYNIFQGSELSHTLSTKSLAALPAAVAADYENVIRSNIPARATALAAEIKANHPDLVGLQEAVLWRTETPPVGIKIPGTATHASYDFVTLLVNALAKLGVHYRAVAITDNVDVQATAAFPSGRTMDVRYTDRVAILALKGVRISNVQDHNYVAHDSFALLGAVSVKVLDGYASVDARVGQASLRFITTHLDGVNDPASAGIRAAETEELIHGPANLAPPTIVTCDCNSTPVTHAYHELTAAGFHDSWALANPGQAGLTCCHRTPPGNPEVSLTDPKVLQGIRERLDYVWFRAPLDTHFTVLAVRRVGTNPADRTSTNPRLWPSDHFGLAANLLLSEL